MYICKFLPFDWEGVGKPQTANIFFYDFPFFLATKINSSTSYQNSPIRIIIKKIPWTVCVSVCGSVRWDRWDWEVAESRPRLLVGAAGSWPSLSAYLSNHCLVTLVSTYYCADRWRGASDHVDKVSTNVPNYLEGKVRFKHSFCVSVNNSTQHR